MRTVLIGAVESSRVALDCLARAAGWSVELVFTLPPARSSRHSDFVDLTGSARAAGSEILHTDNINADEALRAIAKSRPDFVFVVGWSQICGPKFMDACGGRVIGYHPAPLPRMRGRAVIPWTILNQEPITAGTLFWIDDGVDTGAILSQQFFHVAPDETAASLYRKHMDALERMMAPALDSLQGAHPPRVVQDEACATWAARRTPADGSIVWTKSAEEIERLIRAVGGPYPPALTFDGTHLIGIQRAELLADERRFVASPGQVVAVTDSDFMVKCGGAALLRVVEWTHPEQRAPKLHAILFEPPKERLRSMQLRPAVALAYERTQESKHA